MRAGEEEKNHDENARVCTRVRDSVNDGTGNTKGRPNLTPWVRMTGQVRACLDETLAKILPTDLRCLCTLGSNVQGVLS